MVPTCNCQSNSFVSKYFVNRYFGVSIARPGSPENRRCFADLPDVLESARDKNVTQATRRGDRNVTHPTRPRSRSVTQATRSYLNARYSMSQRMIAFAMYASLPASGLTNRRSSANEQRFWTIAWVGNNLGRWLHQPTEGDGSRYPSRSFA